MQVIANTINNIYLSKKVYTIMLVPPQLFNFFVLLGGKLLGIEKILIETQTKSWYISIVGVFFLDNQNVNNGLVRQSMAGYIKNTIGGINTEDETQKNRLSTIIAAIDTLSPLWPELDPNHNIDGDAKSILNVIEEIKKNIAQSVIRKL